MIAPPRPLHEIPLHVASPHRRDLGGRVRSIWRADPAIRSRIECHLPRQELERLTETLDLDAIGRIVGTSPVSLRRYLSGSRETPDDIAARIHWLALTVSDLLGAYNEIGVRRCFDRPRTALEGRSPAQVLTAQWDPEDQAVTAVRHLASALTSPGVGA